MNFLKICYRVVRLQTGLNFNNIYVLLLLLSVSVLTLFLRDDVFSHLSTTELYNYNLLINIILSCSMLYVVFLQANLVCRLTLLITHGLPFLIDKAITLIIKIIYVTYNIILIFLTLLVLRRIYTFMNTYDTNLCYLFKLISINFSCILYHLYMYFNYEKIDYMKIYKQDVKLSYLTIILLSIFPILLILNVTSIFFKNVLNYFTVYCEPGEATSNNNSQINDNGQSNNTTEGGVIIINKVMVTFKNQVLNQVKIIIIKRI